MNDSGALGPDAGISPNELGAEQDLRKQLTGKRAMIAYLTRRLSDARKRAREAEAALVKLHAALRVAYDKNRDCGYQIVELLDENAALKRRIAELEGLVNERA